MSLQLNSQLSSFAEVLFDIAGIVDFITNSIVIYLILWKSSNMKTFRYYLLYFQFCTLILDLYLAFLMKPIPVFPVIGGYTNGILYSLFGVNAHFQMGIQIFLMGIQEIAIGCTFLKKHQSIVPVTGKHRLKKKSYWMLIVFSHFFVFAMVVMFQFSRISGQQQINYMRNNFPELEHLLKTHPSLEVCDRVQNPIILYSLLIFFVGILFALFLVSGLSLDMFLALKRHKFSGSKQNMNQHREIFRSIFAQFAVISLCFLPPLTALLFLILEVPNTQGFLPASLHSILVMSLQLNSQLPLFAEVLFDIAGVLDFLSNSIVIYLIFWKSANMKTFRYYLFYFQFCTLILDLYLAFLMKPIPLFPVIGGYTNGILYSLSGVKAHFQMSIQIFLMGIQEAAIACTFLKKHQSIVPVTGKHGLKKSTYWLWISFFHFIVFVIVVMFQFSRIADQQQIDYMRNNFPELEHLLEIHPSLEVYDRVQNPIILYSLLLLLAGILFALFLISALSLDMFLALKRHKFSGSKHNMNQHREIFRSIFAQFAVISLCFLPPLTALLFLILEVPNTQGTLFFKLLGSRSSDKELSVWSSAMVCTFSFHSFLGALVFILTYPPYRRTVFGCCRKKRKSPKISAIS
ncbi:hypothetical protein CAEBREN_05534 [Caenorhabditis brenneri]|uniref:G protein-coupled receptor n=1 Tax=Caenorhabditis brenneri TaxID=135651 RepID=G0MTZ5_CAEBE|nr:hypothetical protein CAEBREN_05534 [Caenorhabditis brenneri]